MRLFPNTRPQLLPPCWHRIYYCACQHVFRRLSNGDGHHPVVDDLPALPILRGAGRHAVCVSPHAPPAEKPCAWCSGRPRVCIDDGHFHAFDDAGPQHVP
ncbi:MAG TPA: hypothetical protein DCF99_11910 [Flavobacteriaceae bacterium]|nr:hypothetical protein [Flavobacteriaceae bacterium]